MIRVFLVVFLFTIEIFGCATFWQPTYIKDADFNFIDGRFLKEDMENPLYKYAHISSWAYEDRVRYYNRIKKDINLQEWSEYLGISKDKAYLIVYKNESPNIIKNPTKRKNFIEYKKALNNIKEYDTNWKEVLSAFKSLEQKSPDSFFHTRIAYNIIRAYHSLGKFDKEIAFIDSLKRDSSIVWEWIESYKAGAIQNRGDFVESAYLFSRVFATHKSDAYIGYYDFKIRSDKEWNELLKKAQNTQEKTLFHFLRAINPKNNELLELKYMTQIDANSIWVKRLLYLVAQKAQFRVFLLRSGDYESYYDLNKKELISYVDRFLEYLQNNQRDDFSRYLFSYFEYIYHHKRLPVKEVNSQKLLDYLFFIDNLKSVDDDLISKKLLDIESIFKGSDIIKSLEKYTMVKLSQLYPKDSLKAKLAGYFKEYDRFFDGSVFRANLSLQSLNELVALERKKNKNYIEKLMLSSIEIDISDELRNLYYSVLYTKEGNFQKAFEYVKTLKVPPKDYDDIYDGYNSEYMRVSRYNPFNVTFAGNNRNSKHIIYTHKKFLTTMLNIQKQLEKNPNSVMDNFLMANGLYNISDFGNSPMFATIYRATSVINMDNIITLSRAKGYYQKVLSITKDRELKAKVYYQLLKISLNERMIEFTKGSKNYYYKPSFRELGVIFKLLEGNSEYSRLYKELLKYKDTKYFKKIKDCASFKYFR